MSSTNRDYREQYVLHAGDTITSGNTVYTITDELVAYGGSSVIYSAVASESSRKSPIKYIVKEVFPNEDLFARQSGIIRPRDPDNAGELKFHRDHIAEEQILGGLCYNGTNLAVPIRHIVRPDKITIDGKEYTEDIQDGVFAVLDDLSGKAISFAQMLEYIEQPKCNDHPLRNGGCPTLHTTACIIEQVLITLRAIHNNGVLFGDIHMDNVWFSKDCLELGMIHTSCFMDFGCSRPLVDGKKTDIIGGNIFSSKGFTPPELQPRCWEQGDGTISIQADTFSVGCLMLRCLFPGEYWDHFGESPSIGPRTIQRDDAKRLGIDNSLRIKVNDILAQAMHPDPEKRYPSAEAMLEAIQELKRVTEPPKYLLPSNLSSPDYWVPHSRDRELAAITKSVNDGETVFLHGIGGIGKTECAIQLAKDLNPPRGAYLVHFHGSMKETILKMNFSGYKFEPKQKGMSPEELEEAEYRDRLDILKEHYQETVLIIDNFDAPGKMLDDLRSEPAFNDFLGLKLKRILTTRYPVKREEWEIKRLSDSTLLGIMRHYCMHAKKLPDNELIKLIEAVDGHTLTLTLIAKTMEESWGRITPKRILRVLKRSSLSQADFPDVSSDQNRSYQQKQIYSHLKALFNLSGMKATEETVLSAASLLPQSGMNALVFEKSLEKKKERKALHILVKRGWLTISEESKIQMHPIIRSVCKTELNVFERYYFLVLIRMMLPLSLMCIILQVFLGLGIEDTFPNRIMIVGPALLCYAACCWLESRIEQLADTGYRSLAKTLAAAVPMSVAAIFAKMNKPDKVGPVWLVIILLLLLVILSGMKDIWHKKKHIHKP